MLPGSAEFNVGSLNCHFSAMFSLYLRCKGKNCIDSTMCLLGSAVCPVGKQMRTVFLVSVDLGSPPEKRGRKPGVKFERGQESGEHGGDCGGGLVGASGEGRRGRHGEAVLGVAGRKKERREEVWER